MGTPCPPPTLNVQAENPAMHSHRMLMSVTVTKPCHHAFDGDLHKLSCQLSTLPQSFGSANWMILV